MLSALPDLETKVLDFLESRPLIRARCRTCCVHHRTASAHDLPPEPGLRDSHYARPEVMDFCDANDIDFVLGLAGNEVLHHLVEPIADDIRVRRAEADATALRCYTEMRYGAQS